MGVEKNAVVEKLKESELTKRIVDGLIFPCSSEASSSLEGNVREYCTITTGKR